MEALKKTQEMHVDECSRVKLIEHQNIINENDNIVKELTTKVKEFQYEIKCMDDSRDFKAEGVRSGPLSHVPSESALLPPQADQRG